MYAYQALPAARLETPEAEEYRIPRDLPRVVAPFDASPIAAVKNCFDRNTDLRVDVRQLRTYQQSLAQYHLHPESTFHNGDYVDHGLTGRRHVQTDHVEFIGKEANRWEEQFFLGVEPEAQVVYASTVGADTLRVLVRECARTHGLAALATASGVSVRTVGSVVRGVGHSRQATLERLVRAGAWLDEQASQERRETNALLNRVQHACRDTGLRAFARRAGVNPSHLSEV